MSDRPPNLQGIVETYLKNGGFDGLYSYGLYSDEQCECELSNLMPCEQPMQTCQPGYKHIHPEDGWWGIFADKTPVDWDNID